MDNNIYYSYDKVLSRNAMLNFLIGERGVGKTYGITKFVIKRFKNKKKQFVYLRRYKSELAEAVPKFFDKIRDDEDFKNDKFKVGKSSFYINGEEAGYAIPLSIANILKGTTFTNVDTIIFDEFIIDKGCYHYLPNEVIQLLDVIETIARMRNIRVFMLGNAISSTNPYFNFFDIEIPYNTDIKMYKHNLILVNYIKNERYRKAKKETRFGKLIEGTIYEKYAIDNEFLRDSKAFISKKSNNSKFYCIILFNNFYYGVWVDYKKANIYINNICDHNCPRKFVFNSDDMNDNTILFRSKASPFIQNIIERYRYGKLFFSSQKIKNNFMKLLNKWITY